MAGPKPVKVTGKRVLAAFSEYYLEETGKDFYPNYGMIVMAEKLSEYYTMPEVLEAMSYFFNRTGKKDYYDFVYKIDEFFNAAKTQLERDVWFSELERQTSETVKRIHESKRGEAT